ncbi:MULTISPECIES: hypothetical protein [Streptomycetaceae]|uniref:Uncharacterized protein n=1 Tax=Streptantibioticus cattleyicolor (strain ATCC 35852 / DSM 46488 / JCM 4925 / NBRC 14057 / NRRL 8057) TaxID=1003195 RepID=F8JRJ5_STREN|nr:MULTISPECIES: hypothetical protein [Streptomycetaceae]AEW97880.1 hypothetical protein SCATT_55090 [Streptantibioticus cattleyicolor NRRL 8057 = DSM 46488]MYS62290.1 hypothetical protein [Streptomyces sp. SID5468]CCB78196.1 conserved protein of unknown function [Streptantibioticus cattleyicolor NRRL 8057 = DSM 46488]
MGQRFTVEPLGQQEYLVRAESSTQIVESRLQLTKSDLDMLDVPAADERRVAEAAMEFLAERQPTLNLPDFIDLRDIAANYDDFADELRRRLTAA